MQKHCIQSLRRNHCRGRCQAVSGSTDDKCADPSATFCHYSTLSTHNSLQPATTSIPSASQGATKCAQVAPQAIQSSCPTKAHHNCRVARILAPTTRSATIHFATAIRCLHCPARKWQRQPHILCGGQAVLPAACQRGASPNSEG